MSNKIQEDFNLGAASSQEMEDAPFEDYSPRWVQWARKHSPVEYLRDPKLRSTFNQVAKVADILLDTDRKNPLSVVKTSLKLVDLLDKRPKQKNFGPVWESYWAKCGEEDEIFETMVLDQDLAPLFLEILDQRKIFTAVSTPSEDDEPDAEGEKLLTYSFGEGQVICWIDKGTGPATSVVVYEGEKETILTLWRQMLWAKYLKRMTLQMRKNGEVNLDTFERPRHSYQGPLRDKLLNRWRKFIANGVRRAAVLYGPPGTGKSTLSGDVANLLDLRTLVLPYPILGLLLDGEVLYLLLEFLAPELIILDDLDRVEEALLKKLLPVIEENSLKVPLTLVTVNRLDLLPDALRRPGRFDEMWAVPRPDQDGARLQVLYMAEEEGLTLNESALNTMVDRCLDGSLVGAHLREMIRRVAVLGEEEGLEVLPEDLTFNPDHWVHDGDDREDYDEIYDDDDEDEDGVSWHEDEMGNKTATLKDF